MILNFKEIQPFIPSYVFNEYGQLTGNYVYYDQILCVAENGRIQVWLNQSAYDEKDLERLICDYDETVIRGAISDRIGKS